MKINDNDVWNNVYLANKPDELPWTGIGFSSEVEEQIKGLDKNKKLIVTCCGVGDTVEEISKYGFSNIIGTDISDEAIRIAKTRFPNLEFRCFPTQRIGELGADLNIIDWASMHQVNYEDIEDYLRAYNDNAQELILAYIYEPQNGNVESFVKKGEVYCHEPKFVSSKLSNLELVSTHYFSRNSNPLFHTIFEKQFIGLHYKKK